MNNITPRVFCLNALKGAIVTLILAGVVAGVSHTSSTALIPRAEAAAAPAPAQKPNILMIVADDLGYADLSLYGSEIQTPNIDTLARNGMILDNFYTGFTCSPTRSMLMSGMDSHLAGVGVQGGSNRPDHKDQPGYVGYLNFRVASLAEVMSDAGYNTYMAGKWHLGSSRDKISTGPHARGFKQVFASVDGAAHLGGWDWRGPQNSEYYENDNIVNVGPDWYTTRDYTKKMIGYIEADRKENKPFFAYMAYTAPHWPLQAPDESIAKFKGKYDQGYEALYASRFARQKEMGILPKGAELIDNARFNPRWDTLTEEQKKIEARHMEIYAAMVSDLDHYVGELIAYLKSINQFDNTFIIFMSDNGAESSRTDLGQNIQQHVGKAYDHRLENLGRANSYVMYGANWASAGEAPFFRHKATAFEGGSHVPAFVYYPNLVKPGTHAGGVSTVRDVMPTILALTGTPQPGAKFRGRDVLPIQGVSMLPMLQGTTKSIHSDSEIIGSELSGHRYVRQGDWKIVWDQAERPPESRAWKLYNLAQDPSEQHDLSKSNPEKLNQMIKNWDQYARDNGVIY